MVMVISLGEADFGVPILAFQLAIGKLELLFSQQ